MKKSVKIVLSVLLAALSFTLIGCNKGEPPVPEESTSLKVYDLELFFKYGDDNYTYTSRKYISRPKGSVVNLIPYRLETNGYLFEGWYTDSRYLHPILDEEKFVIMKDQTLYGHLVKEN